MEEEKKILDRISEILKDENKAKALESVLNVTNIEDVNTLKEVLDDYRVINEEVNGVSLQDKVNYVIRSPEFMLFYELLQSEDKHNALQLILNNLMDTQIIQIIQKIEEYHNILYGTNGGKDCIEKLHETIKDMENNKFKAEELAEGVRNMGKNLQEECNKVFEDVKKILPGIAAAELGKSFREQREDTEKHLKTWNKIFTISNVVFIAICFCYFAMTLNKDFNFNSFLRVLPLWVFSGFFIYYSTKQISEYKRIATEYRYKESLSTAYIGWRKEVYRQGGEEDEERKQKLLDMTFDAIKINPSDKIGSSGGNIPTLTFLEGIVDVLPLELLKKLHDKISNILNIAKN
ncbi:hypothetical protein [uncultured Campylobacter sp.]|uniref:hypothetical protein n=1 Tax=uncultured Campylobacter sp. TaxID=218934 RepID=UPI0028EF9075|nr:hypothetical protein [uncultured Campylobacter sp.]